MRFPHHRHPSSSFTSRYVSKCRACPLFLPTVITSVHRRSSIYTLLPIWSLSQKAFARDRHWLPSRSRQEFLPPLSGSHSCSIYLLFPAFHRASVKPSLSRHPDNNRALPGSSSLEYARRTGDASHSSRSSRLTPGRCRRFIREYFTDASSRKYATAARVVSTIGARLRRAVEKFAVVR